MRFFYTASMAPNSRSNPYGRDTLNRGIASQSTVRQLRRVKGTESNQRHAG
jgi:hypothetical protein